MPAMFRSIASRSAVSTGVSSASRRMRATVPHDQSLLQQPGCKLWLLRAARILQPGCLRQPGCALPPQCAAGERAGVAAAVDHDPPVDEDEGDPLWQAARLLVGGHVADRLR